MSRKPIPAAPPAESPPTTARPAGKGLSGPVTVAHSDDELVMPHERDQSHGQVASEADPVIVQAGKDLQAGQVDTDMRATPGLDAARRARMVGTPPPADSVGSDPQRAAAGADRRRTKRARR